MAVATNAPYTAALELQVAGPVTLTATAVDNLGARTETAPISFTATGGSSPAIPVSGLVLWLKGDAGLKTNDTAGHVTEWDDQSGNFNHARQKVAARQPLSSQTNLGIHLSCALTYGMTSWKFLIPRASKYSGISPLSSS